MVKNKALPASARPCKHPRLVTLSPSLSLSLSVSLSLSPWQTWPYQGGPHMSSLSLANAVLPEGAPWILPRLDPGRRLFNLKFIESVLASSHFILCHPLFLLPSIPPSIRLFSNESTLHMRWPKYWSFSFSISPSSKHPRLISFMMDWLDLLAVQGTLKSLLQNHSSKASLLQCSALFIVQLSHPYMITGKSIALTRWTFVGKVMSLLLNMLSRMDIITIF